LQNGYPASFSQFAVTQPFQRWRAIFLLQWLLNKVKTFTVDHGCIIKIDETPGLLVMALISALLKQFNRPLTNCSYLFQDFFIP
jgi:hypothetical protein